MNSEVCEPLWTSNPFVLLRPKFSTLNVCESDNVNAFMRAFFIAVVIGYFLSIYFDNSMFFALILFGLLVLYSKWLFAKIHVFSQTAVRESFASPESVKVEYITSPGVAVKTSPSAQNPFMNVLLDELTFNPTRPEAESVTSFQNTKALDDFFRIQWFSDPTDVFGKNQSQRQFYTMPSTSVPNDQASYQNWLYLIPGKTCKEGGRDACVPGTNGGVVPWLSQPN